MNTEWKSKRKYCSLSVINAEIRKKTNIYVKKLISLNIVLEAKSHV